jgi:hypothetical protein
LSGRIALADEDMGKVVGLCGDEICRVLLDPNLYKMAGVSPPESVPVLRLGAWPLLLSASATSSVPKLLP